MSKTENDCSNNISTVSYPRTGKRGVPQQFARRLYDMLQSEANQESAYPDDEVFIQWSASGLAFRILDTKRFTMDVLPKYFRTKKFSSFQRNLNLYGFSKVRRGPDVDMYVHPSFVRGKPELLTHLRKSTSTVSRRTLSSSSSNGDESDTSTSGCSMDHSLARGTPVTPPKANSDPLNLTEVGRSRMTTFQTCPLMPKITCNPQGSCSTTSSGSASGGIGRLDLLALAIEHAI